MSTHLVVGPQTRIAGSGIPSDGCHNDFALPFHECSPCSGLEVFNDDAAVGFRLLQSAPHEIRKPIGRG